MAVIIGSARIDENGKAHGGAAGDQTGKEVSTQAWYDRDWRVLRPKDPVKAKKIAKGMQSACDNANIGYDQYQRQTLYNLVKPLGYDPAKANKKCETDCSALVRVCCCYGGIMVGDFNTESEVRVLMATGEFVELTGSKYTSQSDYLGIGDILVTRKKGHTVVVLSNGPKYDGALTSEPRKLGERILREGDEGEDVEEMQQRLDWIGFHPGEIDGIFGTKTKMAVKDLQTRAGIEVDGEFGPDSYAALVAFEAGVPDEPTPTGDVLISGGNAFIRKGPGKQYPLIDKEKNVAKDGERFVHANPDGWVPVLVDGEIGWVSGKYAKVVDG